MIEVVFGGDGLDSMVTVVGKCKSEWGSFGPWREMGIIRMDLGRKILVTPLGIQRAFSRLSK